MCCFLSKYERHKYDGLEHLSEISHFLTLAKIRRGKGKGKGKRGFV